MVVWEEQEDLALMGSFQLLVALVVAAAVAEIVVDLAAVADIPVEMEVIILFAKVASLCKGELLIILGLIR